ncbi:MAG TPA: TonB-dependent receptor [Thermoanaerobaculia bacterium]|jgi:vitamin B12 transporter|nr:TonB-dependent receptor [Thermoanaerobaculia bacterium]
MQYRHLFLVVIFATAFQLSGQVPAKATEEIVVTASALPEAVESTPAAVTVITRDEIDERAARDVAELLREVPGVHVSRTGSAGRATSLFTRGSNSTHTLVLWNGIEITNPYFAGYDWGRFSTVGVEQVEVVRGPYSALYGSDAMAGVVNVLTTSRRSGFRALAEGGGHGLRNGSVSGTYAASAANASGSFERRDDAGFAANDDFSQTSANVAVRWNASPTFSAGFTARHTSYDLGIPRNLNAAGTAVVPSLQRRQDGTERQLSIPIEQKLGRFSYDLTLAESRRDDAFEDPEDPYGLVDSSTESTTRRARLTTRTETPFGTVVAGGEYERAVVDDVTTFGANFTGGERKERSLFVEDRLSRELSPSSRVELSAGARWDDYETFGSELSPRLALAWIAGSNKLRAAYGEAFRAPAVGELYFPFAGNPALAAERSRSYEIGYDHASGFSATLFRGDYDDLIVFDSATFIFQNIGAATAQGLELALQHKLTRALRASLSYTYTDTEEQGTGEQLLRRPRHSGSLFLGWRAGIVDTNLVVQHTGARVDVLPVSPFARTTAESHTILDANVQLDLGRFTPYVRIENLADVDYEEVLGYTSPGRRAIVGLRFGI